MTKNIDWKRKREHSFPGRANYTRKRLAEVGITRIREDGYDIIIEHECRKIRYSPFTGGFTGLGINSGRGLENLIKLLQ